MAVYRCAEFNIPRSPAERVRSLPVRQSPDDDPNLLSPDELGVLDVFRSTEPADYPFALTLALIGLRFGEASALRWSDVREDEGLIRVSRGQWKRQVSTTKTGVVRSVPLVPELAGTLRDHREQLMARQHPGLAQGWVFSEDDGSLLRKNYLRLPLERVVKRVGIKRRFTVHGFRRTFNNIARQVARGDRHAIDHGARHAGDDRALLARGSRGEAGRGWKRGAPRFRGEEPGWWGIDWGIARSERSDQSAVILQVSEIESSARRGT
jgi:integrase